MPRPKTLPLVLRVFDTGDGVAGVQFASVSLTLPQVRRYLDYMGVVQQLVAKDHAVHELKLWDHAARYGKRGDEWDLMEAPAEDAAGEGEADDRSPYPFIAAAVGLDEGDFEVEALPLNAVIPPFEEESTECDFVRILADEMSWEGLWKHTDVKFTTGAISRLMLMGFGLQLAEAPDQIRALWSALAAASPEDAAVILQTGTPSLYAALRPTDLTPLTSHAKQEVRLQAMAALEHLAPESTEPSVEGVPEPEAPAETPIAGGMALTTKTITPTPAGATETTALPPATPAAHGPATPAGITGATSPDPAPTQQTDLFAAEGQGHHGASAEGFYAALKARSDKEAAAHRARRAQPQATDGEGSPARRPRPRS